MKIGCPKEQTEQEKRVALTPDSAKKLIDMGFLVLIEQGAGKNANFPDEAYQQVGVKIVENVQSLWENSDIIIKVLPPTTNKDLKVDEATLLTANKTLISFFWPNQNETLLKQLASKKVNVIAMDTVPRISRAQKLDALSSMANIAGYKAVIEAAQNFGKFFTGQITAAGKLPPAKFMVIGAGVAGLSAIATARSMGAIVRAFDTRPEVKEQIQSMGAEFLELDFKEDGSGQGGYAKQMSKEFIEAEMALFAEQAKEVDIIVTTALIPGKPAPKLISKEMVESMRPGSVIVDLASEQGGNCAVTKPGKLSVHKGVTVIGYTDLPSRLAGQSSQLYATNVSHLLSELTPRRDGKIDINLEDMVIRRVALTDKGKVIWPAPPLPVSAVPTKPTTKEDHKEEIKSTQIQSDTSSLQQSVKSVFNRFSDVILVGSAAILLYCVGKVAPSSFMQHFTVFVLSCFVGYRLIWNVTPSLHTPLMSLTNAVSSIVIIGALLQVSSPSYLSAILATVGIALASVNIFGGFAVTQRMLKMFRK